PLCANSLPRMVGSVSEISRSLLAAGCRRKPVESRPPLCALKHRNLFRRRTFSAVHANSGVDSRCDRRDHQFGNSASLDDDPFRPLALRIHHGSFCLGGPLVAYLYTSPSCNLSAGRPRSFRPAPTGTRRSNENAAQDPAIGNFTRTRRLRHFVSRSALAELHFRASRRFTTRSYPRARTLPCTTTGQLRRRPAHDCRGYFLVSSRRLVGGGAPRRGARAGLR